MVKRNLIWNWRKKKEKKRRRRNKMTRNTYWNRKEAIKIQKRFYQEQIFLMQEQIIQIQEIINNKDLYI